VVTHEVGANSLRSRRTDTVLFELAGWLVAAALAVALVARTAQAHAGILFTDGDSVLPVLMQRSLAVGQPQDWALSPVLFLPESAVFTLLSLAGASSQATLAVNAVVNLLALYGALRLVSGTRAHARRPVMSALAAFTIVIAVGLLEQATRSVAFAFVTMLTTTTYYSATVIGGIALIGVLRRAIDSGRAGPVALLVGAVVTAVSTLTNPLFAAWIVLPLLVTLALLVLLRTVSLRHAATWATALGLAAVAGYAARALFASHIVADAGQYLRWFDLPSVGSFYGPLAGEALATPAGILRLGIVAGLIALTLVVLVDAVPHRRAATSLVGLVALLSPVLTTVGVLVLGAQADRYLQPWLFLPVLAVIVAVDALPSTARLPARAGRTVVAAAAALALVVTAAVSAPALARSASTLDADVQCVVDWVNASGRTGAGQFWTVRGPKAYLDDPRRLIQVDHRMEFYAWLVNRSDLSGRGQVTFLVEGPRTVPFELPLTVPDVDAPRIDCGAYVIVDYGTPIPVTGAHS
jgi:hypothetical protein